MTSLIFAVFLHEFSFLLSARLGDVHLLEFHSDRGENHGRPLLAFFDLEMREKIEKNKYNDR